ncbi:hypothetical protein SBA3_3530013 [Candidatus Sulfopaludibacter sp. SbA3]|nr:hypothetical protein SBA3_3530013 [Candidatus Sulfopaludibacter sp. SbA3]
MSLYENRAQRRVERNMLILKQLQAERQAALDQVVEEATLLAQYAAAKGEPYHVERDFPPEALPPTICFFTPQNRYPRHPQPASGRRQKALPSRQTALPQGSLKRFPPSAATDL